MFCERDEHMTGRVSVNEVAAAAGVSRATAARALAGVRNVNPTIVETVKRVARELGYERNALASSLRTQKTHMVGMVVPQIDNPFFPIIIEAVERQLQGRGIVLLLCVARDDPELEALRVNALLERRIDGLLISPCHAEASRSTLQQAMRRVPVVQLDRCVDGSVTDWVGSDDGIGVAQVISHLSERGARSFAFVCSQPTSSSAQLRTAAYRTSVAPISPASADRVLAGDFSSEWGRAATQMLLERNEELPDAIVCGSDTIAFGVLHELQTRNIRPPDDVMVTGYDDVGQAFLTFPTLTTVRQPFDEIAATATTLLSVGLREAASHASTQHISIPPTLVARESTHARARPSSPARRARRRATG